MLRLELVCTVGLFNIMRLQLTDVAGNISIFTPTTCAGFNLLPSNVSLQIRFRSLHLGLFHRPIQVADFFTLHPKHLEINCLVLFHFWIVGGMYYTLSAKNKNGKWALCDVITLLKHTVLPIYALFYNSAWCGRSYKTSFFSRYKQRAKNTAVFLG